MAALARLVAAAGIEVLVHAFLDGRDTPPESAREYLAAFAAETPGIAIATVGGRYYAMDRDKRWERLALAYDNLVEGAGERAASADAAVAAGYARGETDEFVKPTAIGGYDGMRDGDGLLMANFRADRVRQLLAALLDPDFAGFARKRRPALRRRAGHERIFGRAEPLPCRAVPARGSERHAGRAVWRGPASTSCASPRPRNTPMSPSSSTAGEERPFPARSASWCPRPRSRPTI